jgi:hypothetical protein
VDTQLPPEYLAQLSAAIDADGYTTDAVVNVPKFQSTYTFPMPAEPGEFRCLLFTPIPRDCRDPSRIQLSQKHAVDFVGEGGVRVCGDFAVAAVTQPFTVKGKPGVGLSPEEAEHNEALAVCTSFFVKPLVVGVESLRKVTSVV